MVQTIFAICWRGRGVPSAQALQLFIHIHWGSSVENYAEMLYQ